MIFFAKYAVCLAIGVCLASLELGYSDWRFWFWVVVLNSLVVLRDWVILK